MNRAEARIKNFQNSSTQIKASNDMSVGNSSFWSELKSNMDESKLARKLGRKKK